MAIAFRATIAIRGINPFVPVSAARAKRLRAGWRGPMPVLVRVNGEPSASAWRINMMPAGDGTFYLYLHGTVRRASATQVGDRVRVEVAFDDSYRGGPPRRLPAWFRAVLGASAKATAGWKTLTPSRQKEIVRYLVNLKTEAARTRNLTRVMAQLAAPRCGVCRRAGSAHRSADGV